MYYKLLEDFVQHEQGDTIRLNPVVGADLVTRGIAEKVQPMSDVDAQRLKDAIEKDAQDEADEAEKVKKADKAIKKVADDIKKKAEEAKKGKTPVKGK